jgi:hypothetical protein
MGCWNAVVPYLCPEIPTEQRDALAYGPKVPLVYTNVFIRNWTSFQKLGVQSIYSPSGYHSGVSLDFPVSLDLPSPGARKSRWSSISPAPLQSRRKLARAARGGALRSPLDDVRDFRARDPPARASWERAASIPQGHPRSVGPTATPGVQLALGWSFPGPGARDRAKSSAGSTSRTRCGTVRLHQRAIDQHPPYEITANDGWG